jgi:hypothetical protein
MSAPSGHLNPAEHAAAILEALDGDYQLAQELSYLIRLTYGNEYTDRLIAFLTPKGQS